MDKRTIRANFVFNIVGAVLPIGIAFVTVPIYIHHVGMARYGVLSIIWILVGYFSFLDLGLSRASANALAKLQDASHDERVGVLLIAFAINIVLGIFGGAILYLIGYYLLENLIILPKELKLELEGVFFWIAALVPLGLISGVAAGALEARERFLLTNLLQSIGSVGVQVIPLIAAMLISPSLAIVIPACVASRILAICLIFVAVILHERPLIFKSANLKMFLSLLSYGGWVSVTNLLSPIVTSLDQVVIGSVQGAASITYYTVPMSFVARSQIFPAALARTLFPRLSWFSPEAAKDLAESAMLTLGFVSSAVCAAAIVLSRPFITIWMGTDFAWAAAPVAELLFIGAWINGLAYIPFAQLQGQGRPDIISKYLLVEVLPFFLILWFLTNHFGIMGAAAAWVIRTPFHFIFFLLVLRFSFHKVLPLVLPLVPVLCAYILVQFVHLGPINAFFTAAAFGFGSLAMGLVLDARIRAFASRLWTQDRLRSAP